MTRPVLVVGALLLAVAARAQPAVDWSTAEPVSVLMVDDRFVPDRLTFRHGVPYQLHLENHGKDLHEFTAPEFLADAIVRDPGVLANAGQEVVVQPGTGRRCVSDADEGRHVPADLRRSRLGRDGGRDRRGVTEQFARLVISGGNVVRDLLARRTAEGQGQ